MIEADLSVIVVAYNGRDELARCLGALASGGGGIQVETIVVDNASRDGAADLVRRRFPDVRLIQNPTNRGFAAACNQGLVLARGRHVFLLNPDATVCPGALETLVAALDGSPDVGVCGPRLVYPDGRPQPSVRTFPTAAALLHRYTPLRALGFLRPAYRRYRMKDFDPGRATDVDTLMGAALCLRRSALAQVGVLDERFFVYFEEVDLCRRMRDAGWRVRYVPEARVEHVGGVSAATGPADLYFLRSLFAYLRKVHGRWAGGMLVAALRLGMFLREGLLLVAEGAAALALGLAGRPARAKRRLRRARQAARFLLRDGWLTFLRP